MTHEQAEELISRTFGYIELANNHEIYFSPHPLRNILSQTTSSINNIEANKIIAYCDNLFVESEVGKYTNIDIHVPPVVEHVISFSRKNKISIPESITAIRNTKNATSFRKYCAILENEIKNLTPRKKISHYQSLLKDIHLNVESWVNDINENVRYRKRKIKLSKLPIIGKLLESAGMHEPEVKDPILKTSTSLFINDIYRPSSRFNVRNMSRRNQLM